MPRLPHILYDSDCGFCRWALAKVLAWDRGRRLRPVAIQDPDAEILLASVPRDRRLLSWHLVQPDGEASSGGAAFAPLFRQLPGGRPFAALAERFPRAAEAGYRFIADRRNVWGRLVPAGAKRRADRRIGQRAGGRSEA